MPIKGKIKTDAPSSLLRMRVIGAQKLKGI